MESLKNYAAKLVFNNKSWTQPTKLVTPGVGIFLKDISVHFGLEEWLNHPIQKSLKIGFIDCYRATTHNNIAETIHLFTFDPSTRNVYHVGNIHGVRQITNAEIVGIRKRLEELGWLNSMEKDFNLLGDTRNIVDNTEYQKIWQSNKVVASTMEAFLVNIIYEEIDFFSPDNWQNLTLKNPSVNSAWKRISKRFISKYI